MRSSLGAVLAAVLGLLAPAGSRSQSAVIPPGWAFVRNLDGFVDRVHAYGDTVFLEESAQLIEGQFRPGYFLRTVDGGVTWDSISYPDQLLGLSLSSPFILTYKQVLRDSQHWDYTLSESRDLGNSFATWKLDTVVANLLPGDIGDIAFSPFDENHLYINSSIMRNSLLFSSPDRGKHWKQIHYPNASTENFAVQVFDARNPARWYLNVLTRSGEMSFERGLYHTEDDGETFVQDSVRYSSYAGIGHEDELRILHELGFRIFEAKVPMTFYRDEDWGAKLGINGHSNHSFGSSFDFAWGRPDTSIMYNTDDSVAMTQNQEYYSYYRTLLCRTFDNGQTLSPLWDDTVSSLSAFLDQTNPQIIWAVTHDSDRYGVPNKSRLLRFPTKSADVAPSLFPTNNALTIRETSPSLLGLEYALEQDGNVRLRIFDLLGRPIRDLSIGFQSAGEHQARIDLPRSLPSGVYIAHLLSSGVDKQAHFTLLH